MRYRVNITEEAEKDLRAIADFYTDTFSSKEFARKYIHFIEDGIHSLEQFPQRHQVRSFKNKTLNNIRMLPLKSYNIVYTVNTKRREVTVLRILYYRVDAINP